MNDIFIRTIPLAYPVGGLTAEDENGDYNVYLNANHPRDKQLRSLHHEMEHIRSGHFGDDRTVSEKENEIKNEPPDGTNGSAKNEIGVV